MRTSGISALLGELIDDPVVQTAVVVLLAVLAVLVYRWWARRYPDEDALPPSDG